MKNTFKDLTLNEVKEKKAEIAKKYLDIRMNKVIGHLDNPLQLRNFRRQIAQCNTIIHEHESVKE